MTCGSSTLCNAFPDSIIVLPGFSSKLCRDRTTAAARDVFPFRSPPPKGEVSCRVTPGLAKTITCEKARKTTVFANAAAARRSLRHAETAKKGTDATHKSNPKYHRIPTTAYISVSISSSGTTNRDVEKRPRQASCQSVQATTKAVTAKMKKGSFRGCTDQMITAGPKLRAARAMSAGVGTCPSAARPRCRIAAHAPR